MVHNHGKQGIDLSNAFKIGIILNLVFIAIEIIYGFLANSMALVADAGHNFSDVLALVFSWIAVKLSERKPTLKFTYGFRRSTILVTILNTVLLFVAVGFLLWETVRRIGEKQVIDSKLVMIVAAAGIVINGFTAWLFVEGKKHDLNIKSAFLHFLADTLVSAGVVLAGLIMALTGINWIDSLMSFIIIAIILYNAYKLLIESVSLALDAVPENIDIREVSGYFSSLPEVIGIHDLHIWALSTNSAALTVHLETNIQTDAFFVHTIRKHLHEKFGIEHATIQVEYGGQPGECYNCN
ncbi:MAG TPA: cation diffusion facilitator family transporter [Bacteroidales bacterium]|nr:cation diffusion facilitator family transporter [Bacteroidales bacterium]HOS72370.1 cation diffusion facilitator family transporter [Bacteroidales bacterium]HQH23090.1 cation diffusion facilitator family transporter [Bacteroidales bacterium]HQJ81052.1 cation diffusion facilitator family transporter [Bacteroidales bacterium]